MDRLQIDFIAEWNYANNCSSGCVCDHSYLLASYKCLSLFTFAIRVCLRFSVVSYTEANKSSPVKMLYCWADSVTLAEVWGDGFWRSLRVRGVCYDNAQINRAPPIKPAICLPPRADERGEETLQRGKRETSGSTVAIAMHRHVYQVSPSPLIYIKHHAN